MELPVCRKPWFLWSPSMRREWIEIPCRNNIESALIQSPSMRREWIEMESSDVEGIHDFVSLHAEGVD